MWHKVKVYAPVGTEFAIVKNNEGIIELIYRNPGEEWPHGIQPVGGQMIIQEGCKSYAVVDEPDEESI